jgi:hypothetical protein
MKKSSPNSAKTAKLPRARAVGEFSVSVKRGSSLLGGSTTAGKKGESSDFISGRIILMQRGKPVGAIVPLEDLSLLEQTEDARDAAVYRAALKKAQREKTVDWETLKKELGL